MKYQISVKTKTKHFGSTAKTYSYLTIDSSQDKKRKKHKYVCHKKRI